jgi:hypothetical protein
MKVFCWDPHFVDTVGKDSVVGLLLVLQLQAMPFEFLREQLNIILLLVQLQLQLLDDAEVLLSAWSLFEV